VLDLLDSLKFTSVVFVQVENGEKEKMMLQLRGEKIEEEN
jgi:hypothetical protein